MSSALCCPVIKLEICIIWFYHKQHIWRFSQECNTLACTGLGIWLLSCQFCFSFDFYLAKNTFPQLPRKNVRNLHSSERFHIWESSSFELERRHRNAINLQIFATLPRLQMFESIWLLSSFSYIYTYVLRKQNAYIYISLFFVTIPLLLFSPSHRHLFCVISALGCLSGAHRTLSLSLSICLR